MASVKDNNKPTPPIPGKDLKVGMFDEPMKVFDFQFKNVELAGQINERNMDMLKKLKTSAAGSEYSVVVNNGIRTSIKMRELKLSLLNFIDVHKSTIDNSIQDTNRSHTDDVMLMSSILVILEKMSEFVAMAMVTNNINKLVIDQLTPI
jgi:hypothetical protein